MIEQQILIHSVCSFDIPLTVDGEPVVVPAYSGGYGEWKGKISETGYEELWDECCSKNHFGCLVLAVLGYHNPSPKHLRKISAWKIRVNPGEIPAGLEVLEPRPVWALERGLYLKVGDGSEFVSITKVSLRPYTDTWGSSTVIIWYPDDEKGIPTCNEFPWFKELAPYRLKRGDGFMKVLRPLQYELSGGGDVDEGE